MFAQVTLELLNGFGMTCKLFGLTLLMALPLGLVISLGVMSPFKPLAGFLKVVIWVVRGTPLLLQLLVIYYGPGIIGQNIWAPETAAGLSRPSLHSLSTIPVTLRKSTAAASSPYPSDSMKPVRYSA